jgi:hypothetical protein
MGAATGDGGAASGGGGHGVACERGWDWSAGLGRTRPGADSDSVTLAPASHRVTGCTPSRASIPRPTAPAKPRP